MGNSGASAPKPDVKTLEGWDDIVNAAQQTMVDVSKIVSMLGELRTEQASRLDSLEHRMDALDGKVDRVMERLDKPMMFKGGSEFYATFGTRIGEEVRASIRAEVGGVAQQVFVSFSSASIKPRAPREPGRGTRPAASGSPGPGADARRCRSRSRPRGPSRPTARPRSPSGTPPRT